MKHCSNFNIFLIELGRMAFYNALTDADQRFLEGENKSGRAICTDFHLSSGIVCKWKQELLQHVLRAFDSDFGEKMGERKVAYLIRCFSFWGAFAELVGRPKFLRV